LYAKFRESIFYKTFMLLNRIERRKLIIYSAIQMSLGLLDLAGVAAIGLLGTLAVTGVQSAPVGGRVFEILRLIGISNLSFQNQVAVIGVGASVLLIGRTILSAYFTKKILFFLGDKTGGLSRRLIEAVLSLPFLQLQKMARQELLHSLTQGVTNMTIGILGSTLSLIADVSLLVIILTGLLIVDPGVAIIACALFALIGYFLLKNVQRRARTLGVVERNLNIRSNDEILEVLNTLREVIVRNRLSFYSSKIGNSRHELSRTLAELSFISNISKYTVEATIVFGAFLLSAFQFLQQDAPHAVATLSIFMAATTRIAPAALRIQQSLIVAKSCVSSVEATLALFQFAKENSKSRRKSETETVPFNQEISLVNVDVDYGVGGAKALTEINLIINPGELIALVGPSGAGKTTIADVLLGIIEPSSGEVRISGFPPAEAIDKWPGSLAYVPQDTRITEGDLRSNVALGFAEDEIDDQSVEQALLLADLSEVMNESGDGIRTQVGESGSKLSGGQRQRLGIARALYTNPRLLVMDEATSSLDAESERRISQTLAGLQGKCTLVIIAHRLSTVVNADRVVYLEKGRILASGSFEKVRETIPNFDKQAKLLGL
jgi:ABC-type multidrug transport system fused ATPase/permease subunit